ncbi:hypothetical protein F5B20DRAFT_591199 [Whalleya microplaca]|nr:hypothetical protein F5B20DRAFT_591199 [Whalleya microplaca]
MDMDSVRDTGPNLRAFLPISSPETRTSLEAYEGIADIFDTRVICSRPIVKLDNLESPPDAISGTLVHGNLTNEMSQLLRLPENRTSTFNISTYELRPGSFLFVQLDTSGGGMISSLDPTNNSTLQNTLYPYFGNDWGAPWTAHGPNNGSDKWPVELGHAFLFLSWQSYPNDEYYSKADEEDYGKYWVVGAVPNSGVENGVWIEYPRNDHAGTGGFKMTVCYDAL